MNEQEAINYNRVADAIAFITLNFKKQPSLEEIAKNVHLSPHHFQKLFTSWAGVSPKKFLQYISINYAKRLLTDKQVTLFDAAFQTGLSGTGRLHDLFVSIEGMTPGEYKNGGHELTINYSFADSPFGVILIASTNKGVCSMAFIESRESGLAELKHRFSYAKFRQRTDAFQQSALKIYSKDWRDIDQVKLHLKGTDFQLKVWEALLKIPFGELATYGKLAAQIGHSGASRAVGTAIGSNPVAFVIPCHRVIQSSGAIGGYMWGSTRKQAIIGWEAAQLELMAS